MLRLLSLFVCGVLCYHATETPGAEAGARVLKAGAAAVDITPKQYPIRMPGGFNAKYAEKAHDPFFARALVFSDDTTTVAMVVLDSLGASPEVLDEAKAIAAEKTGVPRQNMLICSTHTHTGPPSNVKDGPAPEVAFRKQLVEGVAQSIINAHEALQPCSVGAAAHPLPEEVFNRRWFLKPGKMPPNPFGKMDIVKMNPGRSPDVLDRPAGPTDPDISIIAVRDAKRKPLALFANYSLHYVGGSPSGQLSSDYFGEYSRLMPSRLNASDDFIAMMSNGTSGDINNIPFTVTRPPREPFEQIRIVARKAADTSWFAYQKIETFRTDAPLAMLQRDVSLKYRRPNEEDVSRAREVLAIKDKAEIEKLPRLAQNYARQTVRAAEREEETMTVQVQAIRIGDLAVCAIPFETFVEIGLELKDRSPFPQTMVIGLANGRHGYLPTPDQHRLGGYETWLGTNVVQKEASDILIANLLEMLAELDEVDS
ncbi:neutral/alkaline non-lysosomal ceramidase N-terminal domain-containing protein [Rubinisphaera margarita]|uniref:neutral/alkaline non-lysosomal ceramidase N-terminal domain-containing protein n=1 Tax=Rubinisphaera margarita TaxID=2909586 RepID=UPI001EE7C59F|nr:neutral/alkaline non-lysosomal ceramidase N-terminal domain-containing protein [Rubinisphaera margarita]MCG6156554.1 neutral/alkaline non-lysosomal ceramidase N-terminal domain-containing protein [Rubinisphaera margarita]